MLGLGLCLGLGLSLSGSEVNGDSEALDLVATVRVDILCKVRI